MQRSVVNIDEYFFNNIFIEYRHPQLIQMIGVVIMQGIVHFRRFIKVIIRAVTTHPFIKNIVAKIIKLRRVKKMRRNNLRIFAV
jgi:hypothetical protein